MRRDWAGAFSLGEAPGVGIVCGPRRPKGRQPATRRLVLANALDGVDIPLHPGAERYYREAGLAAAVGR